jgi:cobalamin transport system substrate-binding protein
VTIVSVAVQRATAQPSPQRIVSLVPNVTEMLFAIGAGRQVVGVGSYDHFPPQVTELPRVGALLDPDVEKILSLKPDLAVVYESQTDLRQQLARAGIPMFSYKHGGMADVMITLRELGRRIGHAAEGEQAASALERQLADVRRRVAGRPRPRTLLVFGRDPEAIRNVNVSGSFGFLNDMLHIAGGENVVQIRRQSVQLNTEAMIGLAPETIVELRYSGELSEAMRVRAERDWSLLASVPAVRAGRVHVLVGDEYVVPGPRIGGSTEKLARVLHPEAFRP